MIFLFISLCISFYNLPMKKIAVIGSSGGNLRSQGGADPQKMMAEIFAQAKAAGIEVSAIQFI